MARSLTTTWSALAHELGEPWLLPDERLPVATRTVLAWARQEAAARPMAAVLAARQRLHGTLAWLQADAVCVAVARLDVSGLPGDERLAALALARRYGPEEADVARRLQRAARREAGDDAGPAAWLGAQAALVAAWVMLLRGDQPAAQALLEPWPSAQASWVGAVASGGSVEASQRAYQAEQAAWRAATLARILAPLGSVERADEASLWWHAEAAGWRLAAGEAEPERLRRVRPAVLSGEP